MYLSSDYSDGFGSNLSVSGDWATDTIAIGNATVNGVRFGIAYDSNFPCRYPLCFICRIECKLTLMLT
jgi:hypothetical protein